MTQRNRGRRHTLRASLVAAALALAVAGAAQAGGRLEQLERIMAELARETDPARRATLEASKRNLLGMIELELRQAEVRVEELESSAEEAASSAPPRSFLGP